VALPYSSAGTAPMKEEISKKTETMQKVKSYNTPHSAAPSDHLAGNLRKIPPENVSSKERDYQREHFGGSS
jgi:hypothetical protein